MASGRGGGRQMRMSLPPEMSSDRSAYLEGDTSLKPNQGTVFGSLRWGAQLFANPPHAPGGIP